MLFRIDTGEMDGPVQTTEGQARASKSGRVVWRSVHARVCCSGRAMSLRSSECGGVKLPVIQRLKGIRLHLLAGLTAHTLAVLPFPLAALPSHDRDDAAQHFHVPLRPGTSFLRAHSHPGPFMARLLGSKIMQAESPRFWQCFLFPGSLVKVRRSSPSEPVDPAALLDHQPSAWRGLAIPSAAAGTEMESTTLFLHP